MADVNRQITLAARPVGFPKESDFKMVEAPIPQPDDDEVSARAVELDPGFLHGVAGRDRILSRHLAVFDIVDTGVGSQQGLGPLDHGLVRLDDGHLRPVESLQRSLGGAL